MIIVNSNKINPMRIKNKLFSRFISRKRFFSPYGLKNLEFESNNISFLIKNEKKIARFYEKEEENKTDLYHIYDIKSSKDLQTLQRQIDFSNVYIVQQYNIREYKFYKINLIKQLLKNFRYDNPVLNEYTTSKLKAGIYIIQDTYFVEYEQYWRQKIAITVDGENVYKLLLDECKEDYSKFNENYLKRFLNIKDPNLLRFEKIQDMSELSTAICIPFSSIQSPIIQAYLPTNKIINSTDKLSYCNNFLNKEIKYKLDFDEPKFVLDTKTKNKILYCQDIYSYGIVNENPCIYYLKKPSTQQEKSTFNELMSRFNPSDYIQVWQSYYDYNYAEIYYQYDTVNNRKIDLSQSQNFDPNEIGYYLFFTVKQNIPRDTYYIFYLGHKYERDNYPNDMWDNALDLLNMYTSYNLNNNFGYR